MPNDSGTSTGDATGVARSDGLRLDPLLLLICALLAATVVTLLAWMFTAVRASLIDVATARLAAAADMITEEFERGGDRMRNAARDAAKHSELQQLLVAPDDDGAARAAQAAIEPTSRRFVIEVWDRAGRRVWQSAKPAGEPASWAPLFRYEATAPKAEGLQPLVQTEGAVLFQAAAVLPSADGNAERAGLLVVRREVDGAAALALLGRLVDSDAVFIVGNRDGSLWTDLRSPRASMPIDRILAGHSYRDAAGNERLAATRPIDRTPWQLVVESSADATVAPAWSLLRTGTLVGVGVLLLGVLGAMWISRGFVKPLRDATVAAEAVAAGNLSHRLPRVGTVHVRRLADAFNQMADHVEDGRRELEARVERRTEDLRRAMEQLHQAQSELVRKEKLAILGQLAGGVGHELRNPLGVMTNAVFFLEMVLQGTSSEVREYLGIIRQQIELSEKIISDLLDFSRSRQPVAKAVALEQAADKELALLEPPTAVVRDYDSAAPKAKVDPVHLAQILQNLVQNARQAMGDNGGTLTVRTHPYGRDHVRIDVADTGPGVPPELRERIFEPLFTTKARGIGLGLAVSRQLATMNSGELRLEQPGGGGATFSLILPAAEVEASA